MNELWYTFKVQVPEDISSLGCRPSMRDVWATLCKDSSIMPTLGKLLENEVKWGLGQETTVIATDYPVLVEVTFTETVATLHDYNTSIEAPADPYDYIKEITVVHADFRWYRNFVTELYTLAQLPVEQASKHWSALL